MILNRNDVIYEAVSSLNKSQKNFTIFINDEFDQGYLVSIQPVSFIGLLRNLANYDAIGGWTDKSGKYHLDYSIVVSSISAANALATKLGEEAIYSIADKQVVYLDHISEKF